MTRPYELRQKPPLFGEIKNGERYQKNGSWYPRKLTHWKVVARQEKKGNPNFIKLPDVHDEIGEKPKRVPVRLVSDDPQEAFAGFRRFDINGDFKCGAPYRADSEEGRMEATFDKETDRYVPPDKEDEYDDEQLETRKVVKAHRHFDRRGNDVAPYDYPCHQKCRYWNRGSGGDNRCELVHSLYVYLAPELPFSGRLFRYEATSINAQKTISSSLRMLYRHTKGVLAGIPLKLELRIEMQEDPSGTKRPMPHPALIPEANSVKELQAQAVEELERRREQYRAFYGEEPSREDLSETSIISDIHNRSTMDTFAPQDGAPLKEEDEAIDLPDHITNAFDREGYSQKKRTMVAQRYRESSSDRDDMIEKLEDHLDLQNPLADVDIPE